ncbi:hypothetical protein FIBSPDRAFT_1038833 [Athelia psychrophila]|uniref:Uncharacterized protein n=1 Tax=Athelia psychrophila TaxID=1759441 RepID=A0A166SHV1_9AGAM|nr:hypothetical protein FIBSPDRAFT_1038833 [Fibularhizoctonia sp. CBS 109695]
MANSSKFTNTIKLAIVGLADIKPQNIARCDHRFQREQCRQCGSVMCPSWSLENTHSAVHVSTHRHLSGGR